MGKRIEQTIEEKHSSGHYIHVRKKAYTENEAERRQLYKQIRHSSEEICQPLKTEDYVVQPVVDVSPPKWHLGHTTWFFETFLLIPFFKGYTAFDPAYNFVFNSYYESVGARVIRTNRGNLSRPAVEEIYHYRRHVDEAMKAWLNDDITDEQKDIFLLGLNHEQQHQELLYTDIKFILGHNPLFPAYNLKGIEYVEAQQKMEWIPISEGVYEIGYEGEGFCFDNELTRHKVYVQPYKISSRLVSNEEYLQFINDGGYANFRHWHSEGWEWVKTRGAKAPLYWHLIEGEWHTYTLSGLQPIDLQQPVTHINYFEAASFAAWKGSRLPTEAEWEIAAPHFQWGQRWEWTESAYLPYPGFSKAEGAIGEYNGKFMVNQMVLRGASVATPEGHSRVSYRNFFQTSLQWQFTGIRLVQ
jgi:ergothioneine biosynthesis protein EgtB